MVRSHAMENAMHAMIFFTCEPVCCVQVLLLS